MAIGIGETLRAARRERGLTLTDAAGATRIRQRYLSALEDEEFESLGEDVYAKGFLRSYAKFLGLDPGPLLAEYRRSFAHEADEVAALTVPPVARERQSLPRPVRVVASAGALVLLLAVVAVLGDGDGTTAESPPLALLPTPTGAGTPTPEASPTPPVATTDPGEAPDDEPDGGVQVTVVVAGGTSWLRVVVDGDIELEGIQPDGTTLEFSADEEVLLRVGNAGAVQLVVNGEDLGPVGSSGEVVSVSYRAESPEGTSA